MDEPVRIAKCPVHGFQGDRHFCYVCGGPVERVPMIPVAELEPFLQDVRAVVVSYFSGLPKDAAGVDEAMARLDRRLFDEMNEARPLLLGDLEADAASEGERCKCGRNVDGSGEHGGGYGAFCG